MINTQMLAIPDINQAIICASQVVGWRGFESPTQCPEGWGFACGIKPHLIRTLQNKKPCNQSGLHGFL